MGHFSEYYLDYTAEDARMDKADGLPAVQFPKAPAAPRPARYQVGLAQQPQPDDPRFANETEATRAALALATGDQVYAVWMWNAESPETICLVYQGEAYYP